MDDSNYNKFLSELNLHFDNIVSIINPLGIELAEKLNSISISEPQYKVYVIAFDILKRIRNNIAMLQFIRINDTSCVPYRLILRSITGDLIETLYILTIPDKERSSELWKRELEFVVHTNLYGISKYEFFEGRNPNSMKGIDLEHLKQIFPDYVDPDTGTFYSTSGTNRKMSTANMLEHLAKREIFSKEYQQLYSNYKLLSFTEHYNYFGRRYSYWCENDYIVILDIVKWLYVGIDTLGKIIREWLDTGTINTSEN